jgi:hypothetical protein
LSVIGARCPKCLKNRALDFGRNGARTAFVLVLSPESRHDDDRPHDDNDDVTSTDASEEDDVSMRKSYLEALLQ